MTVSHEELRSLAKAATPGTWETKEVRGDVFVAAKPYEGHPYFNRTTTIEIMSDEEYPTKEADASFIAAANPQTVLQLLDEIEVLRESAERHKAALDRVNHSFEFGNMGPGIDADGCKRVRDFIKAELAVAERTMESA